MAQNKIYSELRETMVQQYRDGYNQGVTSVVKSIQKSLESIRGDCNGEGVYEFMVDLLKQIELDISK